jgi:beta-glucosidase
MTVLRSAGQIGQFHDYPAQPHPIGDEDHPASYDPLYEFGHGLSYTEFAYREVALDTETVGPGGTVTVEVTVENVGDRPGREVVQVYSSADGTSLVRPVRRLEGFARLDIGAGETATATVAFPAARLGAYEPDEGHRVEAGEYRLHVGEETLTVTVEGAYC